ncbi:MAG: hypothetical protein ACXADB_03640 [Candidatus Hermodarchaeia archaeon]
MKVYSCSPFMNEYDLLDLKISEESDLVDGIYIIESNQTLQGHSKPLNLRKRRKRYQHPKVHLCFLEDQFTLKDHKGNDKIQKNSVLNFFEYEDDDVLICSDIDEINKKEDIPYIVEQAQKHGLVKMRQHLYYYKINLRRSAKKGWKLAFAITGRMLRKHEGNIIGLRKVKGVTIETNGKHFSYLMTPEMIAYKIANAGHPEYIKDRFLDTELIQERIRNQIDPFERTGAGEIIRLEKVEVDDTYPSTILNNLDYWSRHMS